VGNTGHIFVEVCELLDLFFDWRVAMRILRNIQFVNLSLQSVQLVESALNLPAPRLLRFVLVGGELH